MITYRNTQSDFFDFITSNSLIFPHDVQEKQFVRLCDRGAANVVVPVTMDKDYEAADPASKASKVTDAITARENALTTMGLIPRATQKDIDDAITKHGALVAADFRADKFYKHHVPDSEIERLAKLAIAGVFRTDFPGRDSTGLAFAGYGENEYFPRLQQYRCHGLILGKAYFELEHEITIDHSNAADVLALAQSNMIDTFVMGASFPTMMKTHSIFVDRLNDLENALKKQNLIAATANLDAIKTEAEDAFRREVAAYYYHEHRYPLSRVIASLPINELSELAETLVYIESLKERVTTPDESVSGPIDVAVISKHDGFVWIKRKHYFKPELNHRYFLNQQRES